MCLDYFDMLMSKIIFKKIKKNYFYTFNSKKNKKKQKNIWTRGPKMKNKIK
jgi:hypothetical protein